MATKTKTPLSLVQRYTLRFPGIWETLEKFRTDSAFNTQWNSLCYLPCSVTQAVLNAPTCGNLSDVDACQRCAEATGLYIWRKDKVIYRLDHDLAEVLLEQAKAMDYDVELPIDFLMHLPHDCVYIQTDIFQGSDGFFVWLEYDVNRKEFELRVQLVRDDFSSTIPFFLHLSGHTLGDCIQEGIEQIKQGEMAHRFLDPEYNERLKMLNNDPELSLFREELAGLLNEYQNYQDVQLFAVQTILYLVSENKEVEPNPEQKRIYRPVLKGATIKDKHREIDIEDVGVRIGATLRKYKYKNSNTKSSSATSTARSSKRPHIRRGHWHHYWSGKKDGSEQRTLKLNWIAPTMIRADLKNEGLEDDIITIFPVE